MTGQSKLCCCTTNTSALEVEETGRRSSRAGDAQRHRGPQIREMQPGPGFFELAQKLGQDTSDILACWVAELKKVQTYWSKN